MVSVNDTVRTMILSNPLTFKNRSDVLHYILCVLGNGWEWRNGAPVNTDTETNEPWNVETYSTDINRSRGDAESDSMLAEIYATIDRKIISDCEEIMTTVDERVNIMEALPHVYKQSKSSLLMNVPNNVVDDWAVEVVMMKSYVSQHGWVF